MEYTAKSLAEFLEHQLEYSIRLSKEDWKQIAELVAELNAAKEST